MQNDQSHAGAVGAPDFSAEKWNLLDPGIKTLWILGNLIGFLIVAAVGVGLDIMFRSLAIAETLGFRLYPGVFGILFVLIFGALPFILIGLKYKNTLYLVTEDEVCVRSGIWWKSERYVPRARIQYVDVTSGPIERHMGLATLAVYVGGQAGAGANIAGLKSETAEALRRELVAELPERQAAEVEPPPMAGTAPPLDSPPSDTPVIETPRRPQPPTSETESKSEPSDGPSGTNPWAGDDANAGASGTNPSNPWAGDERSSDDGEKKE